jgi:hypothetical protein
MSQYNERLSPEDEDDDETGRKREMGTRKILRN